MIDLHTKKVGFAMCGSFCTFSHAIRQLEALSQSGCSLLPVMSATAYATDTRFGKADDFHNTIQSLCGGKEIIHTIADAEPIGPKKLVDVLIVCPCTGNTLAKLAGGITDTPVTMAVKSSLRNGIPIVLAIATNDALSGSAQNIGKLLNTKNIFFVPMAQDDPEKKPTSVIAKFDRLLPTVEAALQKKQIQPLLG